MLEPWPEFIKRATRIAEDHLTNANLQEWTTLFLRKQWRWAQRIANQSQDRWSRLVTQWQPELDTKRHAQRQQARPRKRWDDDINNYLQARHSNTNNREPPPEHWLESASKTTWATMEDDYVQHTLNTMFLPPRQPTDHITPTIPSTTNSTTTTPTNNPPTHH